ncbi:hypothetical protein D3C81_2246480 [compost metagenome]
MEHGFGVDQTQAVGAAISDRGLDGFLVGFSTSPVTLQLQQVLQCRHRAGTDLDHALHGHFMGFDGDIAAGIGDEVDLKALVDS